MAETSSERAKTGFSSAGSVGGLWFGYTVFYWGADPEIKEIRKPELDGYIRHRLSLFEPTGFYLDDVILGPAKQPTEGKVFGDVIEECLEAFFSACCEDVKYTQSQEYLADFAENNEFEFYENDICIRHR